MAMQVFADIDHLPAAARALFGQDTFSSESWYRNVIETAIPAHAYAVFLLIGQNGLIPVLNFTGGFSSLTTPYTCLWRPLFPARVEQQAIEKVGMAFGQGCRRHRVIRLDAIDREEAWVTPFLAGTRRAGLRALWFDHFGNWYCSTEGLNWETYLAARPGALRESIRRRTKRLMADRAVFEVIDGGARLAWGIATFINIYAKSWKEPEPFADFNPKLMRACAHEGTLRIGVLRRGDTPLAAQFWIVRDGWAGVQKLAHDEAFKAAAPGTVLTGLMIRHLLENDHVCELDFGRGDDPYKQDWTGARRQRKGVVLVDPFSVEGLACLFTHHIGSLARAIKSRL